jgi:glycosyltransferase involved in cell wall biosynthesis
MTKILSVATAGLRAGQLADVHHQCFPRVDYLEMQALISADIIDYSEYKHTLSGEFFRRLETQIRSDVYLATLSWMKSRRYPLVFTWSERAGIPFAAYKQILQLNSRFVNMFQCWSDRQELVITKMNLFSAMDEIIVHCTSMKHKLIALGADAERIHIIPYSIDQSFYAPQPDAAPEKGLILSVGEPRTRDYASLIKAVDGLPCNLNIAASGHWYAREKNNHIKSRVPDNVTVIRYLPQIELRKLYASAEFVVLPIHDLVYSAGATSTLEASAMARPVVAFRSQGIMDYIIDGETGILVDPGDFNALRDAIQNLLSNPAEARRLGQNARQRIEEELNLETYISKIANLLKQNAPFTD